MSIGTLNIEQVEEVTATRDFGGGSPPIFPEDAGDDNGHQDNRGDEPPVASLYIAILLFIGAEIMFFAGLIGAFIVFRFGSTIWPPPLQVRLPVEVTGVNTGILLFSACTMFRSWKAANRGDLKKLSQGLWITAVLGTVFLAVQGYEWMRLLGFGLSMSGVYGATFFTIIGCHGLHVFAALCWLLVVLRMARAGRFSVRRHFALDLCGMYWAFVVVLWPVLYTLVYLN
jgi:heme/copper-type cytochrome/quinol oxidase subunit 3